MMSSRPPHLCRRDVLARLAVLVSAGGLQRARAEATHLPHPASLPAEAAAAGRLGHPLVLLVSLPGCPYCGEVRRSYLLPLRETLGGGVAQIDVDSAVALVDFDRAVRTDAAYARRHEVTLTPTVLFLDPLGAEVAERLVGAGNPDFYGAYLDQRLDTARRALATRR